MIVTLSSKTKRVFKAVLTLFVCAIGCINLQAQNVSIKGVVRDTAGEPIVGASVVVVGTVTGTSTDVDGLFTLSVPAPADKAVLSVGIIGYETQEVPVGEKTEFVIVLQETSILMEGTVVTALGIKRSEKALSYNVQQLGSDEVTAIKDANFMNSLVGKVAGVTINSGANGAGGSSRVVMRGTKSITGSNTALYVVDGIPMSNVSNSGNASAFSDQPGTDSVADINPDDIESISILTGPSAAALYGNAAAAGVVLITTKKGSAEKTSISISNSTLFSTAAMMPKMQSKYGNAVGQVASWGGEVNSDFDARKFFNTAANVINTVSLSTGNSRNQTYLSASTTNTTGILPNTAYDRYNVTARNTTTFWKDRITLDLGASIIRQNDRNMVSQGYYYNPLPGLYLFPRGENFEDIRLFERFDSTLGHNVNYWPYGNNNVGMQNPYWVQNREVRENQKNRYLYNASLKVRFTDWFDITGRVRVDNTVNRLRYKLHATTDEIFASQAGGYRDITSTDTDLYTDVIATANRNWDNWSVNVNLGASLNDTQHESIGYAGNLLIPNFFAIHNLDRSAKYKPTQSGWHDQSQAVFANAELGWKSKLFLTLTGRNDWESELAYSDFDSFFYYSAGLSAVISSIVRLPSWMSYLKVRGSYADVGNSYPRFMNLIQYPYNGESNSWESSTVYPNHSLKPESTRSWEAGLNAKFLQRINLDVTFYHSNTFNQTFNVKLPSSSGYTSTPIQSGNIQNRGIELALGYNDSWGDFSFSTNYSLTINRNKIIKLADDVKNPITGETIEMDKRLEVGNFGGLDSKIYLEEGGSMGDVYADHLLTRDFNGYVYDDPAAGITISSVESFKLGSIFPKANMGLNTHLGWKGLDLGFTVAARLGGIVMSGTESMLDLYGVSQRSADLRDAGGVQVNLGTISAQKYLTTTSGYAAYYTYDATNVRLQELALNYTLPKSWFADKMKMTLGLVAKNLWMIYCKAPFDPEVSAETSSSYYQGYDLFMLPSTRNIGFNVKLQF